jgi:hypothetical protein
MYYFGKRINLKVVNFKAFSFMDHSTIRNNGPWPASVETSEKSSFFKLKKERNVRIIVGYYNLT